MRVLNNECSIPLKKNLEFKAKELATLESTKEIRMKVVIKSKQ